MHAHLERIDRLEETDQSRWLTMCDFCSRPAGYTGFYSDGRYEVVCARHADILAREAGWAETTAREEHIVCERCGRSPAVKLVIRSYQARGTWGVHWKIRAELCRECGIELLRSRTRETATQGWWGFPTSPFRALWALGSNIAYSRRVSRLEAPTGDREYTLALEERELEVRG